MCGRRVVGWNQQERNVPQCQMERVRDRRQGASVGFAVPVASVCSRARPAPGPGRGGDAIMAAAEVEGVKDQPTSMDATKGRGSVGAGEHAKGFADLDTKFVLLCLFSGPTDTLAESLERECDKHHVARELDLAAPRGVIEGDVAGHFETTCAEAFRAGPFDGPTGIQKKGQRPCVRARRSAAGRGTLMASQTSHLMKKQ